MQKTSLKLNSLHIRVESGIIVSGILSVFIKNHIKSLLCLFVHCFEMCIGICQNNQFWYACKWFTFAFVSLHSKHTLTSTYTVDGRFFSSTFRLCRFYCSQQMFVIIKDFFIFLKKKNTIQNSTQTIFTSTHIFVWKDDYAIRCSSIIMKRWLDFDVCVDLRNDRAINHFSFLNFGSKLYVEMKCSY